jgi:hypothetical protein
MPPWCRWGSNFSRIVGSGIPLYEEAIRILCLGVLNESLAHLGRIDEARELLEGARAQIVDPRFSQRAPWLRPEDYALRVEGLRLAIGQAPKP